MKVIVINPIEHNIYYTEAPDPKIEGYPAWLEWCDNVIGCDAIDVAELSGGDSVIVDDEGLLKGSALFAHVDRLAALAGIAIVVSTDHMGETHPPKCTVEQLHDKVMFVEFLGTQGRIGILQDIVLNNKICCANPECQTSTSIVHAEHQ